MKYQHIFFDLDHTLWDFETNSRQTLEDLYLSYNLASKGVHSFELFYQGYFLHNEKLWDRFRKGFIKIDDLRWKRMWLTLLDFKIGDQNLAMDMAKRFLDLLPTRKTLFPHTVEILTYLTNKGYKLHLITNGFEQVQHFKLKNAGIDSYFGEVITSEGSTFIKPNKEIFQYAFEKTNALPETSIMIGDNIEADIQGAINAGIDQVYMNHLNIAPSIQPTYTVYSLKELQNIF
ncbi:YjjG family noncanonical pyrimidine nucleotidase [Longitalea luteola]|uniref:YjjG family noncanonical pyrimidine nucleotidase n=1 Tax=Longitalea luteola TaxID=2812563 RepID=UPI001A973EC7|nr:YjjG family noncanonical pyrimidine nucleotidase [Longitalea luteola]